MFSRFLFVMKFLTIPLLFVLTFRFGVNAEPASRYKLTCEDYPCSNGELNAANLVNDNYGKQLENRLINNTFYPHPWYWVYKEKSNCKYRVAAREDMPTHMVTMEWIDVDICKETTKLKTY